MKYLLLVFTISFFALTVYAQKNPKIVKSEFKVTDEDFKDVWKKVKKGNRNYIKAKKGFYKLATEHYQKAYEYNSDNAALCYKYGVSAIMVSQNKLALKLLENAYNLDQFVAPDVQFWYGLALQRNSQFDKAIIQYEEFLDLLSDRKRNKVQLLVDKHITECKSGKDLLKTPKRALIDNLGPGVNSTYSEYAPLFSKNDSMVLFTSRRPINKKSKRSQTTYEYFEDIYYTSFKNGKWHESDIFPKPLNSKGNDASVALSSTGKELMLYRGKEKSGNIYMSIFNERKDKWGKPKKVINKINTKKFKETTLSFSNDSAIIYFVSNRSKGEGGKDIYFAKGKNGNWRKPKNIGAILNTEFDEEAVFLGRNDSTLYFSSKGHSSMGGYDIFKSYLLPDGRWTEPENLGFPVNSPDDDLFFSISDNGRFGYYASKSGEGYGDYDIYSIVFLGPEKEIVFPDEKIQLAYYIKPVAEISMEEPVFIKTMRMTVIKGIVTDISGTKPLAANIEIIDNATNEALQLVQTNSQTGAYTVLLPSGKNYGMTANAEGYMFHSENFNIPEASQYQEITKDIRLLSIDPGSKVVLNNVFFDTGKSTLRTESYPELNKLAQVFMLYPKLVVEISGHTDNKGKAATNKKLSKARAQSVVDYLTANGVPSARLVAVGYGSDQPVETNKTEEGRQKNRRVEAKILSK